VIVVRLADLRTGRLRRGDLVEMRRRPVMMIVMVIREMDVPKRGLSVQAEERAAQDPRERRPHLP
jgi:hypothetical protein